PGRDEVGADGRKRDSFELSQEAEEIRRLQTRDREVRAHEAAHAGAGGAYAGGPSFSYEHGPDGRTYAVDGEVSIDVSSVSGDPQATLQKAQQVRAAALAPAEPSAQDMRVAQRAQSMAATARMEVSQTMAAESTGDGGQVTPSATSGDSAESDSIAASTVQSQSSVSTRHAPAGLSRLSVYA
ncbi:MAG: hypothetical protein GXP51_06200, partial [Deltaproteobacteria bacterium]|nr:hypothetical protein [Deltaproteobacteria bacterium]